MWVGSTVLIAVVRYLGVVYVQLATSVGYVVLLVFLLGCGVITQIAPSSTVRFGMSVLDVGCWFSVVGGVLVAISGSVEAFLVPDTSLGYAGGQVMAYRFSQDMRQRILDAAPKDWGWALTEAGDFHVPLHKEAGLYQYLSDSDVAMWLLEDLGGQFEGLKYSGNGRWTVHSPAVSIDADSPEKAIAAVWLHHRYCHD